MVSPVDGAQALDRVEASLSYLAGTGQAPVLYASEAGPDVSRYVGDHVARTVAIHDARPVRDRFSLDRQGFALLQHATAVADLYDEAAVGSVYAGEIEALLTEVCGAARVVVFDHTRRADSTDVRAARMMRDPAKTVHNDYTERSAPRRVRDLLAAPEAEARLRGRFAIVNVWRPIRGPVLRAPLALCDARTVAPGDLVPSERRAKDRIGEIYQAVFNPAHRWYYFPRMGPGEVLVFKTFDSATDGRARFCIHAAFDDPTTPPEAPPRESIETRAFVFF